MNNTNELFNNAELALAAYAELNSNQETSLQVQALKAAKVSSPLLFVAPNLGPSIYQLM